VLLIPVVLHDGEHVNFKLFVLVDSPWQAGRIISFYEIYFIILTENSVKSICASHPCRYVSVSFSLIDYFNI
jgi:hypothetical protein